MRKQILLAASLLLLCLSLTSCAKKVQRPASVLTEGDRAVLGQYERIRAALSHDDIAEARHAAKLMAASQQPVSPSGPANDLYGPAQALAESPALDRARESFRILSVAVIKRAGDVTGYYVMTCPMTPGGEWIQTNTNVDNPYLGRAMHDCGGVKE